MKKRIIAMSISLILTAICVFIAVAANVGTPLIKSIGALILIPAITLIMYHFPYSTFIWMLVFIFFASPIGAVLDLYRFFDFYDKIVHFFSGILTAEVGLRIIQYLLDTYKLSMPKGRLIISSFFAATFSFSCAALWEVYEFCGDTLLDMNMQGKNANTMGDISAGVLGGVLFAFAYFLIKKRSISSTPPEDHKPYMHHSSR